MIDRLINFATLDTLCFVVLVFCTASVLNTLIRAIAGKYSCKCKIHDLDNKKEEAE